MAGELIGDIVSPRTKRWGLVYDPGAKGYWTCGPSIGVRAGGTFKVASLNKNETFSTSDLDDVGGASGTSFAYDGGPGFGAYGEVLLLHDCRWKKPELKPKATTVEYKPEGLVEIKVTKPDGTVATKVLKPGDKPGDSVEINKVVEGLMEEPVKERMVLPFVGIRRFYERSGWGINKKPDGLDSSEAIQTNSGWAVTIGAQYQALSIGGAMLFASSATLNADARSQSKGIAVTGVPIPSNQPYPAVLRLNDVDIPLSGFEFFIRYNLSKFFDVGVKVAKRKTGAFKVTYSGNEDKLSAEHIQSIKENGGVLVGDQTADINSPDDLFFGFEGGLSF